MRSSRRKVIKQFGTLFDASVLAGDAPLFWAQQASASHIEQYLSDPLLQPVCVIGFEPLAKAKLDPLAYTYLMGGLEDEVSLRDNRSGFDGIIIWPKALVDVDKIDLSVEIFGQTWEHPLFLFPAGGKNCIHPDGENTVARAAATAKTLQITKGGIQKFVESGKGPAGWQVTTGGDFCTPQTMRTSVKRIENQGCGAIWCMHSTNRIIHKLTAKGDRILEAVVLSSSDPDPHGMCLYQGRLYCCDAGIAPGAVDSGSPHADYICRIDL